MPDPLKGGKVRRDSLHSMRGKVSTPGEVSPRLTRGASTLHCGPPGNASSDMRLSAHRAPSVATPPGVGRETRTQPKDVNDNRGQDAAKRSAFVPHGCFSRGGRTQ
jgi:hypothetical protein